MLFSFCKSEKSEYEKKKNEKRCEKKKQKLSKVIDSIRDYMYEDQEIMKKCKNQNYKDPKVINVINFKVHESCNIYFFVIFLFIVRPCMLGNLSKTLRH